MTGETAPRLYRSAEGSVEACPGGEVPPGAQEVRPEEFARAGETLPDWRDSLAGTAAGA